jgi:branched-subunit amino acid ABC-type transport system permease component
LWLRSSEAWAAFSAPASAAYQDATAFLVLIVIFLIRPQGILGEKPVEKV